jgi:hypothetical protein
MMTGHDAGCISHSEKVSLSTVRTQIAQVLAKLNASAVGRILERGRQDVLVPMSPEQLAARQQALAQTPGLQVFQDLVVAYVERTSGAEHEFLKHAYSPFWGMLPASMKDLERIALSKAERDAALVRLAEAVGPENHLFFEAARHRHRGS